MNQITQEQISQALSFFIYNFIELTVLFLGVSFLVEIMNLYINPVKVQKLLSSNKGGYLIASSLGALTPFCSCSTIPLTLGLLKARASFGPIMTFLFTSPLLNPIIVAVFWSSFGYEVTIIYSSIALVFSMMAGYTLEKLGFKKYIKNEIFKDDANVTSCCDSSAKEQNKKQAFFHNPNNGIKASMVFNKVHTSTFKPMSNIESKKPNKASQIFSKALMIKTWKQFLSFAPYIAVGIAIGAIVHGFVPEDLLAQYASANNPLAVPISALIGVPLYIRASSMVGLAPALIENGVSMGSILALTVAGAGASLPEMIMLKKIFKAPIMIFFILSVFTMAIVCGYLVNIFFS